MTAARLVLHDVEVDGRRVDVAIEGGCIAAIGEDLASGSMTIDGEGGALLPGLWDHHVHLLATAAALRSIDLSALGVGDAATMQAALRDAAAAVSPESWIRVVGYHESIAGDLDRAALDRMAPTVPVRVQHRGGALWVLNSLGCTVVGLDDPTGRLIGRDSWLRERLADDVPELAAVGQRLARFGVTGVTDMTPVEDDSSWRLLASACEDGRLPQRVVVTGAPALVGEEPPRPLMVGPVKLYLADHDLPGLDEVVADVIDAHGVGRPVAFHSVTRASLVLALAAIDVAGHLPGDRIEHGAVIPPALAAQVAAMELTVVTQPGFIAERGDDYLTDVDPVDQPFLYPCASLLAEGIAVAGSTDAPFGSLDPWRSITAAAHRRTASGQLLGAGETIDARRALDLFLGAHERPGGPPRTIAVGAAADLCLLATPLVDALHEPSSDRVRATVIGGDLVHLAT